MKRPLTSALLAAIAMLSGASVAAPAPAHAATGEVITFTTEFVPVTVHENPTGCHKLPPAAHVLINQTNEQVTLHGDPFCLTPGPIVAPNHGSHVPPESGSFSVP